MSHPILPIIPAVFVPVRDLKSATEWYANLLERQIVPGDYTDGIYIFDFGGTALILDSNSWGSPPLIMFDTNDIASAYQFCAEHQHETLTDIFSDEYVSVFTINLNMICQAHRTGDPAATKPAHALLKKISHILVHSDNLQDSVGWYENLDPEYVEAVGLFYGGFLFIGIFVGALIGYVTSGGRPEFMNGGWIDTLIGTGVGALLGIALGLISNAIIVVTKRK